MQVWQLAEWLNRQGSDEQVFLLGRRLVVASELIDEIDENTIDVDQDQPEEIEAVESK